MSDDLVQDLYTVLHRTRPGTAFFARQRSDEGPWALSWFVREEPRWIEQLGPNPPVHFRAGMFLERVNGNDVAVVPLLLRVGPESWQSLYETWINPFTSPALELLCSQAILEVNLYADERRLVRRLVIANPLQDFANIALSRLANLSYDGASHYETAREQLFKQYPQLQTLWTMLGAIESARR